MDLLATSSIHGRIRPTQTDDAATRSQGTSFHIPFSSRTMTRDLSSVP
jgi:hypothetical protein